MAYLGKNTMGDGKTPLPVVQTGPLAGSLDVNALVGQLVDQQKTYVYDTYKLPSGGTMPQQPVRMFQTPIGQPDPYNGGIPKTEQETNMSVGGQFSPPTDFILNNLGFYFLLGNQLFDIEQITNLVWFEFRILKKVLWMGHLQRHPSGMGYSGQSNVHGDHSWLNGVAEPQKVWHFGDWKKYIPPQVQFSLTLNSNVTYDNYYNVTGQNGAATNIPADIQTKLIATGQATASSRPTLQTQAQGGNGIQLLVILNGISNGPVQ
jgi:hypothetical protein